MPLHTLIPGLALRDGRPWMVFGSEGGHGQAQTHSQLLTRMLVDGDDPQAAITAPRFTVDPGSGRVAIEDHFDPAWIDDLRRRGHDVDVVRAHRHGPGNRARDRVPRKWLPSRFRSVGRRGRGRTLIPYAGRRVGNEASDHDDSESRSPLSDWRASRCSCGCCGEPATSSPPDSWRPASVRPTGSTATSPGTSIRAASSARSSTPPPTACSWSRRRSRCSRRDSPSQ